MADEYSYLEELKSLVVALAQDAAEDDLEEGDLETMCVHLAGTRKRFERALDDQRQAVSDAAPPRES